MIGERDSSGQFHPTAGYSGGRVDYLPNAGLKIHGASAGDDGEYSVVVHGETTTGPVILVSQINVTVNSK